MKKVLIAYFSRTGKTKQMAEYVARVPPPLVPPHQPDIGSAQLLQQSRNRLVQMPLVATSKRGAIIHDVVGPFESFCEQVFRRRLHDPDPVARIIAQRQIVTVRRQRAAASSAAKAGPGDAMPGGTSFQKSKKFRPARWASRM